jgi:hypothetical protein
MEAFIGYGPGCWPQPKCLGGGAPCGRGRHWVESARKSRRLPTAAEVIAVCDELLARFGTATELPLRELFAKTESRNERRHAAAAEMRRFSPSLLTSGPF